MTPDLCKHDSNAHTVDALNAARGLLPWQFACTGREPPGRRSH